MKISIILITLLSFLIINSSNGQVYNMSNTTINTCSGTFYDPGGAGNYGNNQNFSMTICSNNGGQIVLDFTGFPFQVETNFDFLRIYDGTNTAGTQLHNSQTAGGTTNPGLIISTSGCLHITWTSDGSVTYSGWQATISCISCNDGIQNGFETGIDCGGFCPPCSDCNNGIQDGNETGIDCGPTCPEPCHCSDGILSGDETDVDCGGSCFPCPEPCNVDLTYTTPTYNPPPVGGPAYNMPNNSINNVINTCGGTFYDPGGTGNYGNNNLGTQTFCSDMPGGQLQFVFTQWALENCCDYLTIYDGPNTSGTQLFYGHGSTNPGTITSTTGCLTFVWDSDGSVVGAGWTATINCVNVPQPLDCNGGDIVLTAVGQGEYNLVMDNDFDAGDAGTGWNTNITADFSNPCDPSVDGGTYMWMGNSAPHPRIIETVPMDVSCGGEICFYLDFSTQGGASPCEGPDLAGEGVYFEYSTNGGATWVQIDYFHPNGGYDPIMTAWNQYCYTIPPGAMTPNTLFHWAQTGSSGIGNDHWGIDNVTISSLVDCNPYVYNYWHVPGGDDNPVQNTNITQTTTYTVTYTNGADSCTTSITIPVPPGTTADAGPDQTICIGDPAVLIGAAPVTADNGATYSWTSGAGAGTINLGGGINGQVSVSPAVTTTYTLTVTFNGCSMTDDVTITVENCACTVTANNNGPLCSGPGLTVDLTASNIPGATYSWTGPSGFVSNAQNPTNVPVPSAAGTYDFTVEANDNGVLCTDVTTVTVHPLPDANAGPNQIISCASATVQLSGSSATPGINYSWAGPGIVAGGNTATPTVNQIGTYTLTVTNPTTGCINTSTVDVSNDVGIPNAEAGPTQELNCLVTSFVQNGSSTSPGVTFSWAGPGIVSGGNTTTPTLNQPGNYILTVTDLGNGCTNTDNVNITQNIAIPNAVAGPTQELNCLVTSIIQNGASATAGATFAWAGPGIVSGGNTATPTINQPGNYVVTVTDPTNGCTNTDNVNITQNIAIPDANAGPAQIISCATASVQLAGASATPGATFVWAGPGIIAGGNTATPTVDQVGTYTLTVTDPANGCTNTSTVDVANDVGIPNVNPGAAQEITCNDPTVVLNGSSITPGVTFTWAGPGIVSGGNTATPTVNQPGNYVLTVFDASNGCSANANVNVTENLTPPDVDAGATQELTCVVTSVVQNGASATPGATFAWAGPGIVSGGNTATPTIDQPGNYVLTVTDPANGCTNTDNVNITQNIAIPNAVAGPTQELTCLVTSVVQNGSSVTPGVTFAWAGSGIVSGGNTTTPTLNQPGNYVLTVTNPANGCTNTDNVTITQNIAIPDANAGPAQIISCATASVQLAGASATPGATFAWSGPGITAGVNTATPTVNQIGTYTLTITDPANGCTNTSTVDVTNDIGVPNNSPGNEQVITCYDPTVILNGSSTTAGVTFAWAGAGIVSGGNTATPTVDQPGNYVLTVTDPSNGCVSVTDVDVTINITPPNISIAPAQTINCNFPSITINGSSTTPGVSYSWFGPGITAGGNTATPTVNQGGMYVLTVTDLANGCTSIENIVVNEDQVIPEVNFVADTLFGCDALAVNFQEVSGQSGMEYSWSFGDGNSSTNGTSVSNYYNQTGCFDVSLTVTNPVNGCSNSSTAPSLICIIPSPNAAFSASPMSMSSEFGLVTFTNGSTNATTNEWDFGGGNPTSNVVHPTHDYTYEIGTHTIQLVVSNQEICYDTAWISITVIEEEIFYIPNTFTPDGDNYNEHFRPIFTQGFDPYDFTMYIFNRWGEIVWESHNYDVGWDGTYGGKLVQDGTYTWKIEVKTNRNDERKMFTGHVNIIR